jgi:UDP-glucose 4-epimerase
MQKNVMVTGANGFIGSYLVKQLLDDGYTVYAVVRNSESSVCFPDDDNVKVVLSDMSEYKNLPEKLSGVDFEYIYHLAWSGSSGVGREDYKLQLNNVECLLDIIHIAKKLSAKKVIFSGSITQIMYRDYLKQDQIKPEMVTCYAIAKITAEYMAKCLSTSLCVDINWTYIANLYGRGDKTNNFINFLVGKYLNGETPALTNGNQLADFIYVSDVANALISVAKHGTPNESYYIGYGHPRPLREFILAVRDRINPAIDSGLGRKSFEGFDIDFDSIDQNKLYRDTQFKPEMSFDDGISDVLKNK